MHISNRHFRLHTPIAMTADTLGLQSKYLYKNKDIEPWAAKSMWVLISRQDLGAFTKKHGWKDIPRNPAMKPWTDDYTNLISTLYIEK
jgi:hypothetical protein